MTIRHDRSYLPADIDWLIEDGYAEEDLHSLRFQISVADMSVEDANAFMHGVMDAIAKEFVCFQYDKELEKKYRFDSTDWDLFFWCNSLYMTRRIHSDDDRDLTYFTLTFNKCHTPKKRAEIGSGVLALMIKRFMDYDALDVAVQFAVAWNKDKLESDAKTIAEKLDGKRMTYNGFDGRIVRRGGKAYFMKKYAKNIGYSIDAVDLVRFAKKDGGLE